MSTSKVSCFQNPSIKYCGNDDDVVKYLSSLWRSNNSDFGLKFNTEFNDLDDNFNLLKFKKELNRVSDNLVFRGNFAGYTDKLEKEMSLTKKSIVLNRDSCQILYFCLHDFIKHDCIREEIFKKIKYADIFIKHKSGDNCVPKNFRYLSNHSNIFKIIDKFWTNNLINVLEKNKSLPDKSIIRNNFSREYSVSIRDLAIEKLKRYLHNKNLVLLDVSKAFDNVQWPSLIELVTNNISRKVNENFAKKIMKQYMFLNTNRVIKYNENTIEFSKSIATGLPSSTIIFSLLIEQIIYQWSKTDEIKNYTNKFIINTFVDDMYLEFIETKNSLQIIKSLISYLESYGLIINQEKTKTNITFLPFSKIDKTDCYLGLPFARNKKDYILECIKLFQKKYYDINIVEIINILEKNTNEKVKKEIIGFFNYKLYGLLNFQVKEIDVLNIFKSFEKKNK